MIPRNYDVVVADPSPGALIAASLLARAGMSVLVLEAGPPEAHVGRFRFLRHTPPVIGFGRDPLLQRSMKALKFHPHELSAVRKGEPGLQIITQRHRLEIPNHPQALRAEFDREFPRDAAALTQVIERIRQSAEHFSEALDHAVENAGQMGFWQNLGLARPSWTPPLPPDDVPSWGEFLHEADLSDEAKTLLRTLVRPFCSIDVVEDLPLPVAGIHLLAALDGVYSDPGEEHALYQLLLRRVRAMRVDVLPERLTGLLGGRRKIDAATFEDGKDPMPLQFVITGGDPEGLLPLMESGSKGYERTLGRLAPSHMRYSLFLGVREDVIPPDLGEHAIVLGEEEDPDEPGGCLLLSVTPSGSPLAPDGCRAITVSTLLPYGDQGALPSDLDDVASTMLERIKWLIPYLERHIEVLQIPKSIDPTDELPMTVDARPAAWTPAVPPKDDPVAAGLGVEMPHRNVFCAGGAAFPALGLPGESLAGRLVERLAMAGKQRPS